ncbi:MAG: WD40 repeat domain-containing protein [Pirellulales bacterium]|nr:WD40 repeat domain-containing protein [Pirellulales bacterium]
MSLGISRRRILMMTVVGACFTPALAQSPTSIARVDGAVLPVPCRTIGLRQASADADVRIVVTAIAADPQGKLLAVAGDDHKIRILDTSTLAVTRTLSVHRDLIRTLAFDRSGRRLVSAGNDGQLILWDRQHEFREIQKIQGTPALACVCFSPDGSKLAAVGFDNEVFILSQADHRRPVFQCDCQDLRAVAYRDDNRVLAVAGRSGDLHLFDPENGQLLGDHRLHQGRIHGVAFHSDTELVVCVGEDGAVTVFDSQHQQLRHRISVTTGKLFAVTVIDSQRVAVAGSDNEIRIVNTDRGQIESTLEGHQGTVATLAANGSTLFSGGFDATLKRWSIGSLPPSRQRIAEVDPRLDR